MIDDILRLNHFMGDALIALNQVSIICGKIFDKAHLVIANGIRGYVQNCRITQNNHLK